MKLAERILLGFVVIVLVICCRGSQYIDKKQLSDELNQILNLDQKYRREMESVASLNGIDSNEWLTIWKKQDSLDSLNLKRIKEIIEMVGTYPGKSLVGESASEATVYVLQHASDSVQTNYLNLIINACENGELDKSLGAKYHDRYLMHQGKPQVYGTQIRFDFEIDSTTGEKVSVRHLWAISDTTNIDSVRLSRNLEPLEAFLYDLGLSRWD